MDMKNKALGLIETYGYIASIEAADASLKAANVNLIGWEKVTGGLAVIKLEGDVSSVKVAVDAGVAAASIIGKVISKTVIPRPGEGLDVIINPRPGKGKKKKVQDKRKEDGEDKEKAVEKKLDKIDMEIVAPVKDIEKIEFEERQIDIRDREELEELKVVELRRLVRALENIEMGNEEIKYGKKDELITAILSFAERGDK